MINKDRVFLNHIVESSENIIEFIEDINRETFENSRLLQSAVIRELTVIGEATKNLSTDLRDTFINIPWKQIAGMKDKLMHGYFSIDLMTVWNTASKDVPNLKKEIKEILKSMEIL